MISAVLPEERASGLTSNEDEGIGDKSSSGELCQIPDHCERQEYSYFAKNHPLDRNEGFAISHRQYESLKILSNEDGVR